MLTVFDQIPDAFVELYDAQFRTWAREFRRRGKRCAIVFHVKPGSVPILDGEGRRVVRGVWLEAQVEGGGRMVIRPATEHDAEMIARHVREMQGAWLQ